ncbi:MAG: ATP-binding cassette domain-containing protein, partial [Chloroflexi bacterium]
MWVTRHPHRIQNMPGIYMLRVENLTKVYPNGTQALENVSFEVADGEFLAVTGLSGSGKSTLLRCINRLIEPTSGKIFWDDVDITAAEGDDIRKIRRKIGMVFQQFNLVKRSSVITNVLSGRLGYVNTLTSLFHVFLAEDRARAMASLEQVGLAEKAHARLQAAGDDWSIAASSLLRAQVVATTGDTSTVAALAAQAYR